MTNPSPFRYPGGKYKTYHYVSELVALNNCTTYIEPFAGGAAVAIKMLLEGDVNRIILNDFDRSIYAVWHSILNNTDAFIELINNVDVTLETWRQQRLVQADKEDADLLELGFSTLFLNRTNRSGIIKAGVIGGQAQDGKYKIDCRFSKETIIQKIRAIAERRNSILIYNLDAVDFISQVIVKTRSSFTFFDPPYYQQGSGLYTNFYRHEDHEILSREIKKLMRNRKWIVTYDYCPEIGLFYKNLTSKIFSLNYSVASNGKSGREYIFYSKQLVGCELENHLNFICTEEQSVEENC